MQLDFDRRAVGETVGGMGAHPLPVSAATRPAVTTRARSDTPDTLAPPGPVTRARSRNYSKKPPVFCPQLPIDYARLIQLKRWQSCSRPVLPSFAARKEGIINWPSPMPPLPAEISRATHIRSKEA